MSYIEREALLKNTHTYSMEFGEYIGEDVRDVDAILTDRVKEAPAADVVPIEVMRKVLKDWLFDERYCTRGWSAWSYGTMTQNDFVPIDVDEIVDDIVKTANMDGGEKHE